MLIVGEKINTSRKSVKEAVEKRDAEFIKNLAKEQAESGADYIDVNCGTFINDEPEIMEWMVKEIQTAVDNPLCIDSPSPNAIEAGLKHHKNGQAMVNSISGEKERYDAIKPLVTKYGCKIISLCMDDDGIPKDAKKRFDCAKAVIDGLKEEGVKEDDIYIDPLIQPISTDTKNGPSVLETITSIHEYYDEVHTMCGLSNVSYGLPNRKILNQTFMIMCMTVGLDGVILDPTDKKMMAQFTSAKSLLDKDKFCKDYLKAHRKGILEV
ncbi:methyltetrahydrofolate cobalamin methyltransferase [Natranaerofaba carboxydovora]|uniref:methyltetrahydrofolate cobalamin methyltransferase n=1 Tax=Natranaerofaba carboxydovora TaxID=2742683 RepID=UPI001F12B1F0|nr:methyltetrahydrofolate cobalamin methyltransferase [Natranaerofaba carboxydovora]UMZ74783.1 5-methyltetrahydrofolate:corrinoid/iron-sulfur protein co-methyltransferase [Natranaerofaba carboxydovora]